MIKLRQLIILTIVLFLFSCGQSKTEAVDVDRRAKEFINEIGSEKLKALRHLHFIYRGSDGFWQNDSVGSSFYSVRYSSKDNTSEIAVIGGNSERFVEDFDINLNLDTSISSLKLVKTDQNVQVYKNWDDELLKVVELDSLGTKDPFSFFSDLNDLKNKYQLIKITHYNHLGQFIEFYFTTRDVLSYVPDSSDINSQFKSIWAKKWDKGQWMNKNWNLRKLEKPIEVGG